jgi:hypothetical protein
MARAFNGKWDKNKRCPRPSDTVQVDWEKVKTLEDFRLVHTVAPIDIRILRGSPAHKLLERFV